MDSAVPEQLILKGTRKVAERESGKQAVNSDKSSMASSSVHASKVPTSTSLSYKQALQ